MPRKKAPEKEGNSERWLVTYSDLITLLLVFFIILYSTGQTNAGKYKAVASGMNEAMGSGGGGNNIIGTSDGTVGVDQNWTPTDTMIVQQSSEDTKLQSVQENVQKYLQQSGLQTDVSTDIQDRGLVISIKDALFFESGSADVNSSYETKIIEIGKILSKIDNYIVVEGNTDTDPISGGNYKDNLDLASERANNVRRILVSKSGIKGSRISSRSNGEDRPIADNSTAAGKAKNRRVDILILNSKYNVVEGK